LNLDVNNHIGLIDENEVIKFYNSSKNIDYHIEFFKSGLNAVIKKWLDNNCLETPEEIEEIIKSEYKNKNWK